MVVVPAVLDRLYADTPGVVRRCGRSYPAAVTVLPDATVRLVAGPPAVDRRLLAAGSDHLAAVRAAGRVHDGPVLCLARVSTSVATPTVDVVRGGYFAMLATCDALRAELVAAGPDADWDRLPLRVRAHEVAGDPLTSGAGRAAAVGVSALLVVRDRDGTPGVVLGRRSDRVGTDAGRWHVAPSGMLEPATDGRHLETTVGHELEEELGVVSSPGGVAGALRVLGVATDLLRLRPDVVVLLEAASLRPGLGPGLPGGELAAGEEFDALDVVPLTPEARCQPTCPPA